MDAPQSNPDQSDDVEIDGGQSHSTGPTTKFYKEWCETTSICVDGQWDDWEVCFGDLVPIASASSGPVCVRDGAGNLGVLTVRNGIAITNDGWTTSRDPLGRGPGTLPSADEQGCKTALRLAGLGGCGDALQNALSNSP
jgi:hypothetical protein